MMRKAPKMLFRVFICLGETHQKLKLHSSPAPSETDQRINHLIEKQHKREDEAASYALLGFGLISQHEREKSGERDE